MENDQTDLIFPFTEKEFYSLQQANIAASSISLVASTCVVFTYIYMLIYHRKKANRVSLRCVFMCSISEAVSSVIGIVVTTDIVYYCHAAYIVLGFTSIFSSAALTIVGVNLILVFVINVKRRDILERFYYPIIVIFSLVGSLAPIYREITVSSTSKGEYTCWHIAYFLVRARSSFPYVSTSKEHEIYMLALNLTFFVSKIWFYVFIFFSNFIAVICSLIVMIKLFKEHRRMKTVMKSIANQQRRKPIETIQNGMLKKVVLRCTIYPLGRLNKMHMIHGYSQFPSNSSIHFRYIRLRHGNYNRRWYEPYLYYSHA